MRVRFAQQAVLGTLLLCQLYSCLATETPDVNESSKYLDAVRQFADNVLKYGRDTYGPKHTSLFVDGLNAHTHEPVKWIVPNSDRWLLSNSASQQNLIRTLDGLTRMDGDPKYKQAAMGAIKYAFDNLCSPNGLLYWGGHAAYRLDFVPRFDGLIAANGRLYVSTLGGEVLCLSGAQGPPLPPVEDVVVAARKITEQTP